MNCFDCATKGNDVPAVGCCATCGAAVCLGCARLGSRVVHHPAGLGVPFAVAATQVRTIACIPCARDLSEHHAGSYHYRPLATSTGNDCHSATAD